MLHQYSQLLPSKEPSSIEKEQQGCILHCPMHLARYKGKEIVIIESVSIGFFSRKNIFF